MLSARSRAIARPRPVPETPSLVESLKRTKGRNIRDVSGCGMPGPKSVTEMVTLFLDDDSSTPSSSFPPSAAYFFTLETRLLIIWQKASGSARAKAGMGILLDKLRCLFVITSEKIETQPY